MMRPLLSVIVFVTVPMLRAEERADFVTRVQPILQQRCVECHGLDKQRGGLRLDSAAAIEKGGASGVVFVAGKSGESLVIRHVTAAGDSIRMPPKGEPLSAAQIEVLKKWIDEGAKTPAVAAVAGAANVSWAMMPLKRPAVPAAESKWGRNPVDVFILQKLMANGLNPAQEADRRTLIRRLTVDLTGLLPTPEEIDAFQKDTSAEAYEKLVDRLLASPRYGERWARHWLDVAHYADTHGQDEDAPRPNAWPYRDYLIRSFNADKPYATFIKEQIAGDVLFPEYATATIATGFLAAGPWDSSGLAGIREDSLDRLIAYYLDRDDMVSSTMSAFSGLTVGCSRCHDHKFDPISQADYYSLQAVFAGINKADRHYDADPAVARKRVQLQRDLVQARGLKDKTDPLLLTAERQGEAAAFETAWRTEEKRWTVPAVLAMKSNNGAILKSLADKSILSVGPTPVKDTYTITLATTLTDMTGLRLEALPDESLPHGGPGRGNNGNQHLSEIRVLVRERDSARPAEAINLNAAEADFSEAGWGIARAIDGDPATSWGIYPAVGQPHRAIFTFAKPMGFKGGTELTIELDQKLGGSHLFGRFRLALSTEKEPLKAVNQLLPAAVSSVLAVEAAWRTPVQKANLARFAWEQRLTRELAALPATAVIYSGTNRKAIDGPLQTPRPVNLLKRGDATKPGEVAMAGTLSAVPGLPGRFALKDLNNEGERRAGLAEWLARNDNPLTWRVMSNRVWHYHFGKGIVDTPNDFGKMGGPPSHPELLDWLAVEFRDGGGTLKKLHRLIVTSSTYRQAVTHDPAAAAKDGDNRLLWRMNRTRLDAETVRDSVLLLSDRLDETMYGPPVRQFNPIQPLGNVTLEADYDKFDVDAAAMRRRSVYRYVFRTRPDPLFAALDCPDASQSAPARSVSVGALQALALWNNKFTLRHAEHLAAIAAKASSNESEQVTFVVTRLYGRSPTEVERTEWTAYARKHGLANLCRVLLNSSEFLFVD
ncbi:PSD1 and planctomycete cytochrome C domain-containing protein [soil metagenome]